MRISDWSSDVCSSDLFRDALALAFVALSFLRRLRRSRRHRTAAGTVARHRGEFRVPSFPFSPLSLSIASYDRRAARSRSKEAADLVSVSPSFALSHAVFVPHRRSEEHTSELQSLMRISY